MLMTAKKIVGYSLGFDSNVFRILSVNVLKVFNPVEILLATYTANGPFKRVGLW